MVSTHTTPRLHSGVQGLSQEALVRELSCKPFVSMVQLLLLERMIDIMVIQTWVFAG